MGSNAIRESDGIPGEAMARRPREKLRDQLCVSRVLGFGLYFLWVCAAFYNEFLFHLAGPDFRNLLYLDQTVSLAVLALTLVTMPLVVRNADKRVLSRNYIAVSGTVLACSVAMLMGAHDDSELGLVLAVVSALISGISSGVLFLGWGRLYSDVGARVALVEISLAWIVAALSNTVLSYVHPLMAGAAVAAGVIASAWLLRRGAMHRPARPRPSRPHRLRRRTKLMFGRGLLACAAIGLVAGFSDVLTGYRFVPVPDGYPVLLSLGMFAAVAVVLATGLASRRGFVTYAYRATTLLMAIGCMLTLFIFGSFMYSNVVVFGAYTAFNAVLCTICVDVSNYFDQPATRTFGTTFCCLYIGELTGCGLGQLLVSVLGLHTAQLNIVAFVLTLIIVLTNLFLFTEKDLTETGLGEMTDDDVDDGEIADTVSPTEREAWDTRVVEVLVARFGLTPREADVLPLLLKGRTIARIQEELHISQGTVSTHTRHIYQKVGVQNRQGLLDLVEEL